MTFCRKLFLVLLALTPSVATIAMPQIALEKTYIKEGNFSVLLYHPEKIVTPIENTLYKVTDYSYMSYFKSFDIAYTVSYSDWRQAKNAILKKHGVAFTTTAEDLKTTVDGMLHTFKVRLGTSVKINWIKDISYKTYPGKEVEYEFISGNDKYSVKFRSYIINDQTYVLYNVFPIKYIELTQYKAFLDSFKLE